jgi:hypothetical protein
MAGLGAYGRGLGKAEPPRIFLLKWSIFLYVINRYHDQMAERSKAPA